MDDSCSYDGSWQSGCRGQSYPAEKVLGVQCRERVAHHPGIVLDDEGKVLV